MLKICNSPENGQMDNEIAKELLSRLTRDYPTHGLVISRAEAEELGLPVKYVPWRVMIDGNKLNSCMGAVILHLS